METIKRFIDNDPNKGLAYDWKLITKEFKKLKCPDTVYDPTRLPFNTCPYHVILSERSTGKTTNVLLLGMVMNKLYGTVIQYIRAIESMIAPKTLGELMKTILEFHYIEKITNGEYNSCQYRAKKWRYVHVDENGIIDKEAPDHFMYCLSVDQSDTYKSSYNAPFGDFIVFDEFIGKYYRQNEFLYFMDIHKTITRKRESVVTFFLANTIDRHSEYFNELEIYDEVQLLEIGDKQIIKTPLGTSIFVEIARDNAKKSLKDKINDWYYGFKNPQLNAITGRDTWSMNEYPHIESGYETIYQGLYIEFNNKLVAMDVVRYEGLGIMINCHKATATYDDSIIYTLGQLKDSRYRYGFGGGDNLDRFIQKMFRNRRIRYQNNAVGTMVLNHIKNMTMGYI